MRDSIFYSAIRALFVAFCAIIGIILGFFVIILLISSVTSGTATDTRLTTVNTEEILPNAEGKREVASAQSPVILQINIDSVIGMDDLTAKAIRQQLVESREGDFKNNRVKGILLYMDTPGGVATDSDSIYRVLMEYKKQYNVPIYAYVDGLCASGGMYIAIAADKIMASETSLIGSIGVIAPTFLNFTKLLEKVGVDTLTLSAGKDKDAMNPLRAWKPGEDENYKHIIDFLYQKFVDLVTLRRPHLAKEKLVQDYGAKIFPAPMAKEYGYIDESGVSLREALKELVKAAGLEGETYQVIKFENKGWWKSLFSSRAPALLTGEIKHRLSLSPEMDLMMQNRFLYLYTGSSS